MPDRYDEQLPPELQPVASRLRAERAQADPLQLDRLKRRVMVRNEQRHGRPTLMKQRIATLLTILGLTAGTGGAIAVASHGGSTASQGGASTGQYCSHKHKDKGKCKGHHHPGHCSKKGRDHGKCKGHHKHHGSKKHHSHTHKAVDPVSLTG